MQLGPEVGRGILAWNNVRAVYPLTLTNVVKALRCGDLVGRANARRIYVIAHGDHCAARLGSDQHRHHGSCIVLTEVWQVDSAELAGLGEPLSNLHIPGSLICCSDVEHNLKCSLPVFQPRRRLSMALVMFAYALSSIPC